MVFALLDYKGGFENFVGMLIFQPLFAALISTFTVAVCFVVGLPLRLNKKLFMWWSNRFYFPIGLGVTGVALLILSLVYTEVGTYHDGDMLLTTTTPNGWLLASGWFVLGFSVLHLFPPVFLVQSLQTRFLPASAREGL